MNLKRGLRSVGPTTQIFESSFRTYHFKDTTIQFSKDMRTGIESLVILAPKGVDKLQRLHEFYETIEEVAD
jgi:hypothetical protein